MHPVATTLFDAVRFSGYRLCITNGQGAMGYRRFDDREGNTWEIRDDGRDWVLHPVHGDASEERRITPPRNERDPFEYSQLELQRMVDDSQSSRRKPAKNPFLD